MSEKIKPHDVIRHKTAHKTSVIMVTERVHIYSFISTLFHLNFKPVRWMVEEKNILKET